jgi:hypothetical protein
MYQILALALTLACGGALAQSAVLATAADYVSPAREAIDTDEADREALANIRAKGKPVKAVYALRMNPAALTSHLLILATPDGRSQKYLRFSLARDTVWMGESQTGVMTVSVDMNGKMNGKIVDGNRYYQLRPLPGPRKLVAVLEMDRSQPEADDTPPPRAVREAQMEEFLKRKGLMKCPASVGGLFCPYQPPTPVKSR